jgi:hypothetical protein
MFAILVPNFFSSSNSRLRKCHSCQQPISGTLVEENRFRFLTPFRALASKLGRNRALFASEKQNWLEKFRPYGVPSEQWIKEVGDGLRRRTLA